MDKLFSLKNLLWIDAGAAMLWGFIVLIIKSKLSDFFNLPENLLTTLAIVSLAYSSFSIYLAQQKIKSKPLLNILVVGNSVYAIFCVILMIFFFNTANLFGVVYLILESLFVATLAALECRQIKLYFNMIRPFDSAI